MVVHHRAPGTQCYISGARWHVGGASDVPPKSDFEVHSRATTSRTLSIRRPQSRPKKKRLDDMALLDKAIDALAKMLSRSEDPEETTLPDCVPGATCYIGSARWSCTIVHRVHDTILMVHDGHAPFRTGCAMLHWWGTMVVHHCAAGAQCYIGAPHWLCTILHRVHDAKLLWHDGHAPSCTGCAMPYWWGTMVVHHRPPGATCYIAVAQWSCIIVQRVHNGILVLPHGRAPSCTGCTMLY